MTISNNYPSLYINTRQCPARITDRRVMLQWVRPGQVRPATTTFTKLEGETQIFSSLDYRIWLRRWLTLFESKEDKLATFGPSKVRAYLGRGHQDQQRCRLKVYSERSRRTVSLQLHQFLAHSKPHMSPKSSRTSPSSMCHNKPHSTCHKFLWNITNAKKLTTEPFVSMVKKNWANWSEESETLWQLA